MMKKKVKKIPKYAEGTPFYKDANFYSNVGDFLTQQVTDVQQSKQGVTAGGIAKGALSGAAAGAAIGSVVPGIGTAIGAVGGALVGGITSSIGKGHGYNEDSSSTRFADIYEPGSGIASLFGHSKEWAKKNANLVQSGNIAKQQTELIKTDYSNNQNVMVNPNVLVAEGGIIDDYVMAAVSPGELEIDPVTLQYVEYPGDNGKPNSKDNIKKPIKAGKMIASNAAHMKMDNDKTPADNAKMILDSKMPEEMKRKMIKKIFNWQEVNKTKPQEYAMYSEGIKGVNKYGYNKNMSDFAYWDKDKNEYKKEYLDWVNNLTEQDVRDIEAGKYGDMTEYFSKNKGKKLDVATAQKLMTDKKYGNWHKIGQAVVDNKIKTSVPPTVIDSYSLPIKGGTISEIAFNFTDSGKPLITHRIPYIDNNLKKLANPSEADGIIAAYKAQNKGKGTSDWLDEMSNLLPIIGGLFDKYDWHTESSQITPPRFVPVNADPRPLLRAADESLAMARYNQANISPNTGAGMAYGLQAAANRAKSYADAYAWQQDTQNKLITQNAGIYNDWRRQRDAYATQAIADTRANEGAAQQMRDRARKDRLEFYYGKRNDDMLTSMMKPIFEYGTPDEAYRPIYKRRIV